jgi:hypothetical protein
MSEICSSVTADFSTMSAVPSGLLSSTTRIEAAGSAKRTRSSTVAMLAASL